MNLDELSWYFGLCFAETKLQMHGSCEKSLAYRGPIVLHLEFSPVDAFVFSQREHELSRAKVTNEVIAQVHVNDSVISVKHRSQSARPDVTQMVLGQIQ